MSVTVVTTLQTEPLTVLSSPGMPVAETTPRDTFTVVFTDCSSGLGIKIIGGVAEEEGDQDFGIFIRKVLPGGLAEEDGRLQEADQLLQVNGNSLLAITNDGNDCYRAVQLLRQASSDNHVELVVQRTLHARDEYVDLLSAYSSSSASSVCDPSSLLSRSSTPSVPGQSSSHWGAAHSPVYSSASGPVLQSLQDRVCESPHSGVDAESESSPPHHPLASLHHLLASPSMELPTTAHTRPNSGGLGAGVGHPKISNAAAASMQRKSQLMAPAMASTPQEIHGAASRHNNSSAEGASGAGYDLSPVTATQLFTPTSQPALTDYTTPHNVQHRGQRSANHRPPSRRLSLDPSMRLRVEKLEVALRYLGVDPQPQQQAILRSQLVVDDQGTVLYGDFVKAARVVFKTQLEERHISPGAMLLAAGDITDFTDPPAFHPEMGGRADLPINDELDLVRRERDELRQEVLRLNAVIHEKDMSCSIAEEETLRIRRDAQGALHESRSLRSKVALAEQAHHAARGMEQDYEEVVRLLEAEITTLRTQQRRQLESPAVQKRLAVLASQLRKSELSKKTYEVATEKLLQFAEHVHNTMSTQDSVPQPSNSGPRPPSYNSKQKDGTPNTLATEAKDVTKAVKSLIEIEPLPFGWDETYTADGMKYYINHVTQMTTWQHPISNVQHGTQSRKSIGDSPQTAISSAGVGNNNTLPRAHGQKSASRINRRSAGNPQKKLS